MSDISDPGRAGRRDRKRARKLIDAAYAAGQLTAADRALRTERVESAHTKGDLAVLVRDLNRAAGAAPAAAAATSVHFVSPQAIDDGLADRLAVNRRLVPVRDVRKVGKADMPLNDALPRIEVDPDTFTVTVDGDVWAEQPAVELPMAQRYFLF